MEKSQNDTDDLDKETLSWIASDCVANEILLPVSFRKNGNTLEIGFKRKIVYGLDTTHIWDSSLKIIEDIVESRLLLDISFIKQECTNGTIKVTFKIDGKKQGKSYPNKLEIEEPIEESEISDPDEGECVGTVDSKVERRSHSERIRTAKEKMDTLAKLVWQIPDVDEAGYSHYKIEFATSVMMDYIEHNFMPAWERLCEEMFIALLGGEERFRKDFEYVFWKWAQWVHKEKAFGDVPEPKAADLERPEWLD